MPAIAGVLAVLAAGVAGFLVAAPPGGGEDLATVSDDAGVEVSLPNGWSGSGTAPRLPGLELDGGIAAAPPNGRVALLAGRLRGLAGSVYPAGVAEAVDPKPGAPQPVQLARYEALRFEGLDARGGPLTLFVAPTSEGTLVAACLAGAPVRACESAAASLELAGGIGARAWPRGGASRPASRSRCASSTVADPSL